MRMWLPKSSPVLIAAAMMSSKMASLQITASRSISATLAGAKAAKILLPTATLRSVRKRSCALTRSDPLSGDSDAPSVSRPLQSSAGSKKVADLELKDTLLFSEPSDENKVLELDELWSFVYRKSEKVWVWLALCRESRQIVAFVIGRPQQGNLRMSVARDPRELQGLNLLQ